MRIDVKLFNFKHALALGFSILVCLLISLVISYRDSISDRFLYQSSLPLTNHITEIIFIDADVAYSDVLTADIDERTNVFLLENHQSSGIAAITKILERYSHIKALHIVSHGNAGRLLLGVDALHIGSLPNYRNQLNQWKKSLTVGADILLYGCNVASSKEGVKFLQQLSQLTQTDVAASNDLTGSDRLGGNWNLEIATGDIETAIAFSTEARSNYNAVLKQLSVTTTADAGTGSLRWAIEQAHATPEDDLIDLSQVSGKITLQSSLPDINSSLTIAGNGDDTISGNHAHRVLYVDQGDVTLRDLTIADGLAVGNDGINGAGGAAGMGGGLFVNGGKVTLSKITFVNNHALGGNGTQRVKDTKMRWATQVQSRIQTDKNNFDVNRGGIVGINGISLPNLDGIDVGADGVRIDGSSDKYRANRGAIAGVNGIGIGGIGTIAFGGGGGFGGFGNAGNGGNGGNGGEDGGNGGNGGDGGNGGVGIFGSFDVWDERGIGTAVFSGGAGFGGFGNAGNGGEGGEAKDPIANGGNGGDGGNGGFGGGGGSGGGGGKGGDIGIAGRLGIPGRGGFGGGDGGIGFGGGGGGFGGAMFVRSGSVILSNTSFENNSAIAGTGSNRGFGKGGAIFIVTEALKNQANVKTAPRVRALGGSPIFVNNVASQASDTATDNPDVYGTIQMK